MRKRILAAALAGTAVFGTVTGLAASLNVTAGHLGSGDATVSACDTNGVGSTYTLTSGTNNVAAVVVTGIADPGCSGAEVAVQVLNSSGTILGSGSATHTDADGDTTDNSQSVSLNTEVASDQIGTVRVTLNG